MTNVSVQQPNRPVITVGTPINDVLNQNPPSGIQYASLESLWSGQETSYYTGDEGWRYQNGDFDNYVLPNPAKVARLDSNAANPRLTLVDDNIFGNKDRYTAPDGAQNYTTFAVAGLGNTLGIVIDHYFGLALAIPLNQNINYSTTFSEAVAVGQAINDSGYSVFSIMAIKEMLEYADNELEYNLDYTPFNFNTSSGGVATSTINRANTNWLKVLYRFYNMTANSAFRVTDIRQYFFTKNIQQQLQP